MSSISHLSPALCKQLVRMGRKTGDPETALRFLVVAKFGSGLSRTRVAAALSCAISTVAGAVSRFLSNGPEALLDRRVGNGAAKVGAAFLSELRIVLYLTPPYCGWERPTWTRELLALEMEQRGFARVAPCTMGRALSAIAARRGRPKPIVLCPWPHRRRQHVLAVLRRLAATSTAEEPVVYADEVDLHLNPKIGLDWMNRGDQRWVVTPGKNEKHYIAGALNAVTNELTWVEGERKTSPLFCDLADPLVEEHPNAKKIHIILDNYIIHSSKLTQRHIERLAGKIVLHFLPPYCPDHNRIERMWQELHANVTRNHRCKTIAELLIRCFAFLDDYNHPERCKLSLRTALPVAA